MQEEQQPYLRRVDRLNNRMPTRGAAAAAAAATTAGLLLCCCLTSPASAWRLPASSLPSRPTALRSHMRFQPRLAPAVQRGRPLKMADAPLPPAPEMLSIEPMQAPFRPDLGVGRDAVLTKVLELNGGNDFVRVNVGELALSAVRKMNEKNADCCLIFDDAGKLAGIFTERDYIRKIVEAQRKTRETPIAEIMTPVAKVVSAPPTMSVGDCMALLVEKKIRHVPIIDAGGSVQGVVSTTDLVNTMKRDDESLAGAFPLGSLDTEAVVDMIAQSRERANAMAVKGGEKLSAQDYVRGGMVGLGAGVLALLLQVGVFVFGGRSSVMRVLATKAWPLSASVSNLYLSRVWRGVAQGSWLHNHEVVSMVAIFLLGYVAIIFESIFEFNKVGPVRLVVVPRPLSFPFLHPPHTSHTSHISPPPFFSCPETHTGRGGPPDGRGALGGLRRDGGGAGRGGGLCAARAQ